MRSQRTTVGRPTSASPLSGSANGRGAGPARSYTRAVNGPPHRRRYLFVTNFLGSAGAETQLIHLATGLAERGHEVSIAAFGGVHVDSQPLERLGIGIHSFEAASRARKVARVPALARLARRADVVHCSTFDATLWGRLAAALACRKAIVTEHTPGREVQTSSSGRSRQRLIALHSRVLDAVTYATVVVARWQVPLVQGEGVRPDSILHIPNAVPMQELREASHGGVTRTQLGIPEDAKVVLHAARLFPHKGQRDTLAAVRRLRESVGDVHAVIAGHGPDREELEREAAEAGGWAHVLGPRDDVPALLALSDLAVVPSRAEAMPMIVIEAMGLGVPVVGTDVGDVRGILEEAGSGISVPVDDFEAFYAACRAVLADPSLHRRLAEGARKSSEAFDSPAMTERYDTLFEAAVEGREIPATLR